MSRRVFLVSVFLSILPVLSFADNVSVGTLPNKGSVTLSGVIDTMESNHEFMFRDDTGIIRVIMASPPAQPLKAGEKVSVSGEMVEGFFGNASKSIDANKVVPETDPMLKGAEAQAAAAGMISVKIKELPPEGLVKVTGSVGRVTDPRNFNLQDTTGNVDVDVDASEKAGFTPGSEVTVIGYVEKGGASKSIHATRVILSQSSLSAAGGG